MSNADRVIDALRAVHDDLDRRVAVLTDDDLTGPSGASEWTVAQVLSHIGSGAEISLATLLSALGEGPAPDQEFNQGVWARWDAMSPREQADAARASDTALVERYEGLDDATRSSTQVTFAFLPEPVGLDVAAALRLNEAALHVWDVAVAEDASAVVHPAAVPVLLDTFAGPLGFMLGFLGQSGPTATLAVRTSAPDQAFTLQTGEKVALTSGEPGSYDGTLALPAEAFLRLVFGRLQPGVTPDGVSVDGPLDVAGLRAVFPGF